MSNPTEVFETWLLRRVAEAVEGGEVFLINLHISTYPMAHGENHDPIRKRRLLLNKREIRKLWGATNEKGFTIVPLKIYFKGPYAKVEIGDDKKTERVVFHKAGEDVFATRADEPGAMKLFAAEWTDTLKLLDAVK